MDPKAHGMFPDCPFSHVHFVVMEGEVWSEMRVENPHPYRAIMGYLRSLPGMSIPDMETF